jgi:hypothetical protein
MGHRSQPKVQLYLWKPSINAGALPIAISFEERQTAPYVWVHPDEERSTALQHEGGAFSSVSNCRNNGCFGTKVPFTN